MTCKGDCVRCFDVIAGDRSERDFAMADGVFIKAIQVDETGTDLPQHAHRYDHTTLLAHGSVRFWCDDVLMGDFSAPHTMFIKAGVMHMFRTLEPDTTLYCIHNTARNGAVEILEPSLKGIV